MAYIAWVIYGTTNNGCIDYLGLDAAGEDLYLVNNIMRPAIRFKTIEEAKECC